MLKKRTLIIVVIVIIIILLLLASALFIFRVITSKTAISIEDLVSEMSSRGFEVLVASEVGSTEDIAAYAALMEDAAICTSDQCRLEFYVLTSDELAYRLFVDQKTAISENPNNSPAAEVSISIGSYAYYSITTGEYFYYLAYIDNTMLFVGSTLDNQSVAKQIIKDLNY